MKIPTEATPDLYPSRLASGTLLIVVLVLSGFFSFPGICHAARTINSVTLDGATAVTVNSGATITAAANVTTTGSGSAVRWRSTGWRISTTPPGTVTCVNHPNHNSAGTYTENFSITAPAGEGTYNVYFIAYNNDTCSSGASSTYSLSNGVIVHIPPSVLSINRDNPNPTNLASVSWTVTFTNSVTGVDASDFTLIQGSGMSGATITSVSGSGTVWTVTASTGIGIGTLGLNLVDNDSIIDGGGSPLGGTGGGNGNFTGQVYTVSISQNCTSQVSGNWNQPATWSQCRGGIPLADDTTTIAAGHTVTLNVNTPALAALTINSGGTLTNTGANTITVNGNLGNGGSYSGGSGAVSITGNFNNSGSYTTGSATTSLSGNFTNSGTFTAGSGTWAFSGSSSQLISGATTFNKLTLNNAAGVSLNSSLTAAGTVALNNTVLNTGGSTLTASANCNSPSVTRGTGYVAGKLRLTFPSGTTTCTYHVGSGTTYAPIGVAMVASAGGTLTGSTAGYEHPQIANSVIDPTKDANRYWSLWMLGDTITATSYGATFNFASSDLDISATAANFVIGRYTAGLWSLPTPITATATATGVSGIAGPLTSPNDFAVGEIPAACSPPSIPGLPAMTCVCDSFNRTNLNPSTIYDQNWFVANKNQSSTFGDPRIVNTGYLRLTDNSQEVATVANVPSIFPAAGNMIVIEFKHYAYDGSGADGIALTLSDATLSPTPGAFGGSLGYAQKSTDSDCATPGGCPGFNGGWIGVAIDEFGNFSNPTEGRVGGPGSRPDSVAVRGSGSGLLAGDYPYLVGSGTLTPGIDNPGSTSAAYGHAYRVMVDARNYTPTNKTTTVSVYRDTTGTGNNYTQVIAPFDVYVVNSLQAAVPTNWKLSLTGSTGAVTNIHEISNLKVCAQAITPPAGYRIQVDNLSPNTCAVAGGDPPAPIVTISAVDSNESVITNYMGVVTLAAKLSGGGNSTAIWSKVIGGASGNLTASTGTGNQTYSFAAGDAGVARFYLTDAFSQDVYLTVTESAGSPATSLATPLQYRGGSFTVAVNDPLGNGVVAGRPHRMQATRTNCGTGTDTTYIGVKALDGWYNPTIDDHPSGATAPQICPLNSDNSCLPAAGSPCTTLSIAAPSLSAGSNNLSLTFTDGSANFCLVTNDIGKYSLGLRDDSNVASPINGSSPTLTVRPFAVVVSDVLQGLLQNPGSNNATGTIFSKAGAAFQASVAGYLWSNPGDSNSDGLPDTEVAYANVTAAGLAPHYADTVTLSATTPITPDTGILGTISNGGVAVSGGAGIGTTLGYSEVGSFTLAATPATNYLNSGVNLGDRAVIFATSTTTPTLLVGRFIPDHFDLGGATIVNRSGAGCLPASIFTYMGEPMNASFTLTAKNTAGGVTQNYVDSYAKFTNSTPYSSWTTYGATNSLGLWMIATSHSVPPGTCTVLFNNATPSTTSFSCTGVTNPTNIARTAGSRVILSSAPDMAWLAGVGTFAANVTLERANSPDGPYLTLNLGVAPQDGDGVTLLSSAFDLDADNSGSPERKSLGTTAVRFGRLVLQNAYGPETAAIKMRLLTQYYNGTSFIQNPDDTCSKYTATAPATDLTCANLIGPITCADVTATGVAVTNGQYFTLTPLLKKTGTLLYTLAAAPAWLQYEWDGADNDYDENPTGRANFGIYRGNDRIINWREIIR